jgi:iron complex outermembrane recepter protein
MSFRVKLVSLFAAAALFATGQAFAQEAAPAAAPEAAAEPEPAQRGVEEIIITATKRDANIQEVPIAVSAFQGDELEARRIDEIEDLAQVSPSIHVNTSNTASAGGTLRIRGVGTTGNNIGLEASVGVFIDGVYRSRSGQAFSDLLDIERIEILRGPQGTLFGKNTSAGAVNVVTKRPSLSETEAFAQLELGDFNHRRLAASYSAPLIDEVLGVRLSGVWSKRDGTFEDIQGKDAWNDRKRYTMRGQLLWVPTDAIDIRLIADFSERDESCCPAVWVRGGASMSRVGIAARWTLIAASMFRTVRGTSGKSA